MKNIENRKYPYPYNILHSLYKNENEDMIKKDKFNQLKYHMTEDQIRGLEFAINELTDREAISLNLRYKFGYSYRKLAIKLECTGEGARQIIYRSLLKLSKNNSFNYIYYGYDTYNNMQKVHDQDSHINYEEIYLDKMNELSHRAVYALSKNNVITMKDLIDLVTDDYGKLLHIRNLGSKSLKEIYTALYNTHVINEDEYNSLCYRKSKYLIRIRDFEYNGYTLDQINNIKIVKNDDITENTSLYFLNIPTRAYRSLRRNNILTVKDLMYLMENPNKIKDIKEFGTVSYFQCATELIRLGFLDKKYPKEIIYCKTLNIRDR